jgi:cell division protein FtsB
LNADWGEEGLDEIRRLQLELLEEHRLMDESARIQEIENKIEQAEFRLDETKNRAEEIKKEIEEYEKHAPSPGLKLYLWASVLSAVLGLVFSFLNPTIGLLLGVLGIIGSALFVFFKGLGQKEASLRLKEQRGKLNGIMATIDKLQQEIDDLSGSTTRGSILFIGRIAIS